MSYYPLQINEKVTYIVQFKKQCSHLPRHRICNTLLKLSVHCNLTLGMHDSHQLLRMTILMCWLPMRMTGLKTKCWFPTRMTRLSTGFQ